MAPDPRIEMLVVHDLVSQNFGILHYNAISYGPPDMTTWDPKRGYEAMPSGDVYRFFGELIGGTVISAKGDEPAKLLGVEKNGERRILHLNGEVKSMVLHLTRKDVGTKNSRYECASLVPKGPKTENPLRLGKDSIANQEGEILPDGITFTVPPYSVNYIRCFAPTSIKK